MAEKRQRIITASEIGQYTFCSVSWKLQQQGFTPDERVFEQGNLHHHNYGQQLQTYTHQKGHSKKLLLTGIILILFSSLLILMRLIL